MSTRNRVQSPAPKATIASKTPVTQAKPKSFFQKYIAPNAFNFYPVASLIGIAYYAYKNGFDFDKTMSNGGDQLVFFLCVKLCMLHNGIAHLNPKCTQIVHKSQGLTPSPASLMFENELGAVCLSMSIFAFFAGDGVAVATISKVVGGFFFYAAARHVYVGQPIGTALGGIGTCVFLFVAGFHASPLKYTKVLANLKTFGW